VFLVTFGTLVAKPSIAIRLDRNLVSMLLLVLSTCSDT
jgi:hypothetical protein